MLPSYAEKYDLEKVKYEIDNYPSQYPTPKWLLFVQSLLLTGWIVGVHKAETTHSKYVYIRKDKKRYKIRFSNHRPSKKKELYGDADFYVGISNLNVTTTEQVLQEINKN